MRRFNTNEVIDLRIHLTEDYEPVQSATVNVSVYEESNPGVAVLDAQNCPEVSGFPGYYKYNWTHGFTTRKQLIAKYVYGTLEFSEHIVVDVDLVKEIDDQDADMDGVAL